MANWVYTSIQKPGQNEAVICSDATTCGSALVHYDSGSAIGATVGGYFSSFSLSSGSPFDCVVVHSSDQISETTCISVRKTVCMCTDPSMKKSAPFTNYLTPINISAVHS